MLQRGGSHLQKQRAAAGHQGGFAPEVQPLLEQRLAAAGPHHSGQGPAGEGGELLPGAAGQDHGPGGHQQPAFGPGPRQAPSAFLAPGVEYADPGAHLDPRRGLGCEQAPGRARLLPGKVAPDLAAWTERLVQDADLDPLRGGRGGGGQARRSGANHRQVRLDRCRGSGSGFNHGS